MDWILNNIWEICAIAIPTIAAIGIVIYQRRLNRKKLSYEIVYQDEIVKANTQLDGLKFSYHGEEISGLFLVIVRVINDGRKTISSNDFESSLVFTFENIDRFVGVELLNKKPNNIELDLYTKVSTISLEPTLLNSKDEFTFQVLIPNVKNINLTVNARIKGVSTITKVKNKSRNMWFEKTSLVLVAIVGSIFMLWLKPELERLPQIIYTLASVYTLMFIAPIIYTKFKRK